MGVAYTGSGSGWNGTIDEVRLYNRGLSSAEVSAIYSYTGGPPDSTPPSTPGNVSATAVSPSQINVSWSASTDNVGVAGYRLFRNGTLAGTVATLSYSDTGLAASTTYSYTVSAFDAAGNVSGLSTAATATTGAVDTTPPSVSITAPSANSTVSNTITVTATASDNVAVGDVQFQLDGVNLGADLTSAPYTISWNTATASNGSHNLTAIARDTSHNSTTSAVVQVTVNNTVTGPPSGGLIGYWNFDEGSGSVAHDTSGGGHDGAVNGAAWTTGKINTGLRFTGTSSAITPAFALGAPFSISAWVNPSVIPQVGYVRIAETHYATGFYLGTDTTGTKYKLIVNGGSGITGSCSYGCAEGGTISSGWHLVTATFDGATARLYVDNAVVGSDTFTPSTASLPFNIGVAYTGSGYGWNGTIDEVRLYNRALTAAEVNAIFNY
jgi:chitodextrinase